MKSNYMLLAALCCSTLYPTIVKMEKFYNPETQQTVILAGDRHLVLPEVDGPQRDALAQMIASSAAHLVNETYAQATAGDTAESKILLMDILREACEKQQTPVHGIEFRRSYGPLPRFFMSKMQSYQELMKIAENLETASDLYRALDLSWQESYRTFRKIVSYVQSIPKSANYTPKDQAYLQIFDELLGAYDKRKNVFFKAFEDHEDKAGQQEQVRLFLQNAFVPEEDGSAAIQREGLGRLTEDALNNIFDASILQKLHELKHAPTVIVHTGQFHLKDFADKYLQRLGFESQYKVTASDEHCMPLILEFFKSGLSPEEWLNSEERAKLLSTIDYQSCGVDVQKFLDECKTLKK
jgi:hypothetical protein